MVKRYSLVSIVLCSLSFLINANFPTRIRLVASDGQSFEYSYPLESLPEQFRSLGHYSCFENQSQGNLLEITFKFPTVSSLVMPMLIRTFIFSHANENTGFDSEIIQKAFYRMLRNNNAVAQLEPSLQFLDALDPLFIPNKKELIQAAARHVCVLSRGKEFPLPQAPSLQEALDDWFFLMYGENVISDDDGILTISDAFLKELSCSNYIGAKFMLAHKYWKNEKLAKVIHLLDGVDDNEARSLIQNAKYWLNVKESANYPRPRDVCD